MVQIKVPVQFGKCLLTTVHEAFKGVLYYHAFP